ncbi:MAG: DUF3696 domain-containing protein [Bryobacteraceae bacterium]
MALRLRFEGIRCFSEPQEAVIRPITLLVGENSSGKTTFLALCQIAHAISQGVGKDLPFNEPPFLLGAYDQIASYRGRRAGRAGSFSLAIELDADNHPQSICQEFVSEHGQPSLHKVRLMAGNLVLEVKSGSDTEQPSIALEGPRGKTEVPVWPSPFHDSWPQPPAGRRVNIGDLMRKSFTFDLWPQMSAPAWSARVADAVRNTIQDTGGLWGETALAESDFESLGSALKAIQKEFMHRPYAFAPIRTSPQRTYDPVIAEPKPEGSHIPMFLAILSRSAATQPWTALQSALQEFGRKSGLFEGIEIVNKGRKESDPFQIGIKTGGPAFNLIDVGYGVSQALPILVDTLQRASGSQFFLLQQPEVHLHPKAQAELGSFFARQANKSGRFVIETHSDYLVDRIRMEVRRKQLDPQDVSLLYFERLEHGAKIHNLELDANGGITNPPPGYRQFFLNEERDLLGI